MSMSRPKAQENWKRLVSELKLSKEEQSKVHRHLENNYHLEKDNMSYEELKRAAREVV